MEETAFLIEGDNRKEVYVTENNGIYTIPGVKILFPCNIEYRGEIKRVNLIKGQMIGRTWMNYVTIS